MLSDKLKNIDDSNRLQVLRGLTPEELNIAHSDQWTKIFQEIALVNKSNIMLREKKELMRQIYPYYQLPSEDRIRMQGEAYQVFDDLMKHPVFLHSVHRWQNGPQEERPQVMQTVVGILKDIVPGANQTRIETFNEETNTLGYATASDTSDVVHVNVNPKVFEKRDLSKVTGTLYHELTHKIQHRQLQERPHLNAPYFDPSPGEYRKSELLKQGYQFTSRDYEAYRHHPLEIEAHLKGNELSEIIQEKIEQGLGKGLMNNPYDETKEEKKYQDDPLVRIGGISEDKNPYRHLYAGIAEAKKLSDLKTARQGNIGDCLRHFQAVVAHGEFLSNSPAKEMLSMLSYYMKHSLFRQAVQQSGYKNLPNKIFQRCANSPNPELKAKAGLILKLQTSKDQQSTGQTPDNHYAVDIRDAFKDRQPVINEKNENQSALKSERQRKSEEIQRKLGLGLQLSRKRGISF